MVVLGVASWMVVHGRSWTAADVQSLGADAGFAQVNYEEDYRSTSEVIFLMEKTSLVWPGLAHLF